MNLHQKHDKLAADHRAIKYSFVLTELDLALTFCEMAMGSRDKAKSLRNTGNAQRAYDVAMHFLDEAGYSGSMKSNVQQKVARLKTMLRRLNGRRDDFTGAGTAPVR